MSVATFESTLTDDERDWARGLNALTPSAIQAVVKKVPVVSTPDIQQIQGLTIPIFRCGSLDPFIDSCLGVSTSLILLLVSARVKPFGRTDATLAAIVNL